MEKTKRGQGLAELTQMAALAALGWGRTCHVKMVQASTPSMISFPRLNVHSSDGHAFEATAQREQTN